MQFLCDKEMNRDMITFENFPVHNNLVQCFKALFLYK